MRTPANGTGSIFASVSTTRRSASTWRIRARDSSPETRADVWSGPRVGGSSWSIESPTGGGSTGRAAPRCGSRSNTTVPGAAISSSRRSPPDPTYRSLHPARRAEMVHRAHLAPRRGGLADGSAVLDEHVGERKPLLPQHDLHEILLDLVRILLF